MPKATRTPANGASASADRKLKAAERKAAKIVADAEAEAARLRGEAEDHARRLVLDARATAEGVRAEGMELVSNLREMGDALRANAERLLHDVQSIHARMVGDLDRVDPGRGDAESSAEPAPPLESAAESDELDVPDFIPHR